MQNTEPPAETVADRVRRLLRNKGVSGSELARRTGMKQPYISRRLTGEVEFRVSELEQIAAVLGIPVHHLIPAPEPTPGGAR